MVTTPRSGRLGVMALALAAIAVVGAGCVNLPARYRSDIPTGVPPAAGAPVPYLDINAPGRTADELNAWAIPISKGTGIGVTALEAYGNAAEIQRQQHPECGITWTTLAGIAGTESKHGRHHGARIAANGDVANKIGTYTKAVLARRHGVPFYVAIPLSTDRKSVV